MAVELPCLFAATRIDVLISSREEETGSLLEVDVVDNAPRAESGGGPRGRKRRRGGLGVPALTERVEALGGSLSAGPMSAGGWRLIATLPISETR